MAKAEQIKQEAEDKAEAEKVQLQNEVNAKGEKEKAEAEDAADFEKIRLE